MKKPNTAFGASRTTLTGLILGNVALVALCGFGLWRAYGLAQHPLVTYAAPETKPDTLLAVSPSVSPTSDVKSYESKKLAIAFQYPANWDVHEYEQQITVTSPLINFRGFQGNEMEANLTGNLIIEIDPSAENFLHGDTFIADSVRADKVMPGSSYKDRYLSFVGESRNGQLYFGAIADTGHYAYKSGQSATDLRTLLPKIYGKYSIITGYLRKDSSCQNPCRELVPISEYRKDPLFDKSLDIMKSVSFQL